MYFLSVWRFLELIVVVIVVEVYKKYKLVWECCKGVYFFPYQKMKVLLGSSCKTIIIMIIISIIS